MLICSGGGGGGVENPLVEVLVETLLDLAVTLFETPLFDGGGGGDFA